MPGECDRVALIHALAALAGRHISDAESRSVIEHHRQLPAQRANEIWAQHRRAPTTVSLRDYLAMTLKFLDQARPADGPPPAGCDRTGCPGSAPGLSAQAATVPAPRLGEDDQHRRERSR